MLLQMASRIMRTALDIDDPVRTLYSHDRDFRKFQSLDVRDCFS